MPELEEKIGYHFKNPHFLEQALTHASATSDIHRNYERLEFLGDRILGVTVADMLCRMFADEAEGALAQRFVGLVCKETVAEVVRALTMDKFIISLDPHVHSSENVLCDIGEALIAAIYLDSGSMAEAQAFIRRCWTPLIDRKSRPHKDAKTLLQEVASRKKLPAPVYRMLKKTGSEHAPQFRVAVEVGADISAEGTGRNIKMAEQNAAESALKILEAGNA